MQELSRVAQFVVQSFYVAVVVLLSERYCELHKAWCKPELCGRTAKAA